MEDRKFGARYDWVTKVISAVVVVLLVAVPVMAMRRGAVPALAALVPAAVIGLSFAFSPRGYEISGGALRVKRLIGEWCFH